MPKRRRIVGVSWRKLQDSPITPGRRQETGKEKGTMGEQVESAITNNIARVMTRMMSFRDTFDTLRQVSVVGISRMPLGALTDDVLLTKAPDSVVSQTFNWILIEYSKQ
jgi:hypothetical protein